jgi:hypothetical protein
VAKKPGLLSPTAFLRRGALYKGVFGGSRGWMVVGAALWGPRLLRRTLGRKEEILATERLVGGQAVRIDSLRPLTRRQRRAVARTR